MSNLSDVFFGLERRPAWTGVQWYALGLATSAAVLGAGLVSLGVSVDAPVVALAALAFVALLAEKQSVHITAHTEMSVSVLPILFAAVVYGPLAAMIVGACAMLGDFGRPYTRWVVWTSSRSLVSGFAGVAALLLVPDKASFGLLLIAVAAATVTEALVDSSLIAGTAALRGNASFAETLRSLGRLMVATVPLYTPVVAILAYAYLVLSPWTVLLFFLPALGAHRLLVLYQEQRRLTEDVVAANKQLERANLSFASALVAALDARDRYTAGHSAAVAVYARDIAARLGLSQEQQQLAHLSGLLHDVGKVGLPPGLLEKTGALTLQERRKMQEHAEIGERILANVADYAEIATIVRHHHERVDGNGYPDGHSWRRDPAHLADHRRCGRLQRDDIRQALS